MWLYCTSGEAVKPIVLYEYHGRKAKLHAETFCRDSEANCTLLQISLNLKLQYGILEIIKVVGEWRKLLC